VGDELDRVLTDFFVCDEETEGDIKDIRDTLTEKGLAGFAEKSGFNEKVPLDVIRSYLTRRLEGESQPHGFLSSGVTFCTMLPMRSIPFKVVYVLGMNDADYPRTSQKPGFDLMEQKKRLCDRSKRYEDRYLFLETILSARENLIISYQGQSIKDNSEIPPSVLVCELCDYIEQAFGVEGGEPVLEHVVTKHPLQPFSRKYFNDDKKLFSYSVENFLAGAEAEKQDSEKNTFMRKPLPRPSEDEWKSISVDQLYYFFANPSEFLIRNRLNANLKLEDPVKPEEREPFELDNLQQYSLKQELLDMCLAGQDLDAYFETVRASGTLPHGSAGESEYQVRKHEAVLFAKNVMQHTKGGLLKPVEILLDFEDMNISISAVPGNLYPEGQLFFRCANIKTKDRLRAWLYHLALNAGDNYAGTKKTILLGKDEGAVFSEMENDQAMSILKSLIDLFVRGLTAPLCFFPETSYAYAEAFQKNREEARALKAARVKWYPGYYNTGDCEDIYIKTCFGSEMPDSDEFRSIAAEVFEPMLNIILPQRH